MLEVRDLIKSFEGPDGSRAEVVRIPSFTLGAAKERALRGESGCGKTTFLNLVSGILAPDSGSILIGGADMAGISESGRDRLRAQRIGYIFQTFNLLQGYTVLENVVLGMSFAPGGADFTRARELLVRVGLGHRLGHFPRQLSTGQQQRVAVARALANRPALVLADEPTGNLDRRNAREALGLIRGVCAESGASLLLVSHDEEILGQFGEAEDFHAINTAAGAGSP
ncbi:MAG TPA: ABC transporter ATP-binding protein [Opitutaceae bacterium]|jgi:putative ABC transport system ATP-binding protein